MSLGPAQTATPPFGGRWLSWNAARSESIRRQCDEFLSRLTPEEYKRAQEEAAKKRLWEPARRLRMEIPLNAAQIKLIRELRSDTCRCLRPKGAGKTFCYTCYKLLPPEQQKALYKRIGQGYEEAYTDAERTLKAHRRFL